MSASKEEKYGKKEAQERFEKALRGGLKTPPKPLKDVPKKRDKPQGKGKHPASHAKPV